MIPLAIKFKSDGFDFRQIHRSDDIAIYSKSKGEFTGLEVVLVQKRAEHTWPNGSTTPAHEAMPGSESWGTKGWSYTDRTAALARMSALMQMPPSIKQPRAV